MMTPLTTVKPYRFSLYDCNHNLVKYLSERFVKCTEDDMPILENMYEVAEILMDAQGFTKYERLGAIVNSKYYYTHKVELNFRRFLCVAVVAPGAEGVEGPRVPDPD